MTNLNEFFDHLKVLAASPARRLRTKAAAEYLGVHPRTLEESRRSWRRADKEGKPELRRGPKFVKVGNRILYEVRDLDAAKALAARLADGLPTDAAAEHLGRHPRTLENWRRWCERAEREGMPELQRGPKFSKAGGRVSYTPKDLDEFLARTEGPERDGSQWLNAGER